MKERNDTMADNSVIFTSLCRVEEHPNENIDATLYRCADIKNGELVQIVSQNSKFADSHYIYRKEITQQVGTYGIWNWSVEPNQNDPDRPYFHSWYDRSPIEILNFGNISSLEELVKRIKTFGFKKRLVSDSVLFCIPLAKGAGKYACVFCSKDDLTDDGNITTINDSVVSLPRCIISPNDIFFVTNTNSPNNERYSFYKYLNIDATQYVPVMKPLEVVKKVVDEQFIWKAAQKQGITKNEWQKLKEFIKEINIESISEKICEIYHCSLDEAEKYLKMFISNVDQYVDQTTVNDQVIDGIITNHPALVSKFEMAVEKRWQEKNQERIQSALDEFNRMNADVEKRKEALSEIEQRTKDLNEQYELLSLEISEKEELGSRVEEKINSKLIEAQKDVSTLLASFPFLSLGNQSSVRPEKTIIQNDSKDGYLPGVKISEDDIESYDNWNDLIGIINEDLIESSVTDEARIGFAAFLYAAYLEKASVFLIGPNAEAIANAFSASLFGSLSGTLDCSYDYSPQNVEKMLSSSDKVIIIKNVFNTGWLQHIPDIISHKEKFFFILHPFTEDILIEPQSLFNYAIPIFTEMLVENAPSNQFLGGAPTTKFEDPIIKEPKHVNLNMLEKIGASKIFRTRMQKIFNILGVFYTDQNDVIKCLLGYLPIAYISGNGEKMMEEIGKKIPSNIRKEISAFLRLQDE